MASKRMFSEKILESDAFIDMQLQSQILYVHLCMAADDDGFIGSPNRVTRMIGAEKKHYEELLSKRFILSFPSGVCVIKHWLINNTIKKDRCVETVYREEKEILAIKDNKAYTERKKNGNKTEPIMETEWNQNDSEIVPQVSIGKDSIDKGSVDKSNKNIIPPEMEWVEKYCEERKNEIDVEKFMNYYTSNGWQIGKTKMKDWQAAIRTWEKNREVKPTETKKQLEQPVKQEEESRFAPLTEEERKMFFDRGAFMIDEDGECVDFSELTEEERIYLQKKGVI